MTKALAAILVVSAAAALGGCSTATISGFDFWKSYEIEGNNTGGIIPPQLVRGDVQAAADKFCGQYGRVAKITFNSGQPGASVVFICIDKGAAPPPPPEPENRAPQAENPPPPPPATKGGPSRTRTQ